MILIDECHKRGNFSMHLRGIGAVIDLPIVPEE